VFLYKLYRNEVCVLLYKLYKNGDTQTPFL
jgi:hypothetical protein